LTEKVGLIVGFLVDTLAIGKVEGVGEGLMDQVGLFVGFSEGDISVGEVEGDGEGLMHTVYELVGSSLVTSLGSKLFSF
jgi:hypothetical protein